MGLIGRQTSGAAAPGTGRIADGAGGYLRQVLAVILLVLLLWVFDAIIDATFFGERSFKGFLLAPSPHELSDFAMVIFLLGCLLLYSIRLNRARGALERALQEALNEAEVERAKVVALVDTIPNPIYSQDLSGNLLDCNAAFADWVAQPRELIVGRTLAEIALLQDCRVFGMNESGTATVRESPVRHGDGTLREVIFYKTRFVDGSGEVGVMIDITERKRAEAEIVGLNGALLQQAVELQRANLDLEGFSHAISHDLRTPLTRISCSGQALLESRERLDSDGLFFLKSINDGCLQVEALIDALMVLSRVTGAELGHEQVDLSGIAEKKAAELQLAEPQRRVEFRIVPRLLAQGDPQLLHVALDNLIRNAWKYTVHAPQPCIEFGALAGPEGETVYFLKDNGAGFDSARSEQLFQPFRRLHSTQEFPGSGLGLATVQRIIRRHNGRVWGEGKPGCGATFYFTLNE